MADVPVPSDYVLGPLTLVPLAATCAVRPYDAYLTSKLNELMGRYSVLLSPRDPRQRPGIMLFVERGT
jgi:hypothetical protein